MQVLSVTSLGAFLVLVNIGTLNVALPELIRYFHADAATSSWILLSYMLVNTILSDFGLRSNFEYFWKRKDVLNRVGWVTNTTPLTEPRTRVDRYEGILVFIALAGLILALSKGGEVGWRDKQVIGGFAVFAVITPIFLWYEHRSASPLLEDHISRCRHVNQENRSSSPILAWNTPIPIRTSAALIRSRRDFPYWATACGAVNRHRDWLISYSQYDGDHVIRF